MQNVEGEVGVPQVAVVVDCGSAHVPIEPLVSGLSEELFILLCKAVPKFQTCAVGRLCGPAAVRNSGFKSFIGSD